MVILFSPTFTQISFYSSGRNMNAMSASGMNSKQSVLMNKKVPRAEKIEAELKLLEWHKLANDAALKVTCLLSLLT